MDRNIQESKEYRLAKEWEMAVNSYSFDPRKFAAAIPGPQKIRCGYPRHAPHASAEPLPAYQGVYQGHGGRQPPLR